MSQNAEDVLLAEFYTDRIRQLETELAEARREHLYWKGVVRGARAELSKMGRLTNEEYANLCADSDARNFVDELNAKMEALKSAGDGLAESYLKLLKSATERPGLQPGSGAHTRYEIRLNGRELDQLQELIANWWRVREEK